MSKKYTQINKDEKLSLKYGCVQPDIKKYMATFKRETPPALWQHIKDLYELIDYQMKKQMRQEQQITAIKHIDAWKRYDKNLDEYDPDTRSYKK